jgi:hypothetical protein
MYQRLSDQLKAMVDGQGKLEDRLTKAIFKLEDRLIAMEAGQGKLEDRLTKAMVDGQGKLEVRLIAMEAEQGKMGQRLIALEAGQGKLEDRLTKAMVDGQGKLEVRLIALEAGQSQLTAHAATDIPAFRRAVIPDAAAHFFGARATWSLIRINGKYYAVCAGHCALFYAVSAASNFTPVFLLADIAKVATRLIVPKRQVFRDGGSNESFGRDDVVLVELTGEPAGMSGAAVDVELEDVTQQALDDVGIIIGHAAGSNVTGSRPLIADEAADEWHAGCVIFLESSGEPGNSAGCVVVGKRAGKKPLVLGAYHGVVDASSRLRARGVVVPLKDPAKHPADFSVFPLTTSIAEPVSISLLASLRTPLPGEDSSVTKFVHEPFKWKKDPSGIPSYHGHSFLWAPGRFNMDGSAVTAKCGGLPMFGPASGTTAA